MGNKFQVFKQESQIAVSAEAGEHLNQLLLENKSRAVLLMLSGGSAFSLLDYIGQTAMGENLTVSVLDERFSQDHGVNNFAQLQKHDFYQLALTAETSFFGTLPRNGETAGDLAKRWEKNLRTWQEENPEGLIIATLGIGADGHTAGIFPSDDVQKFNNLFKTSNWVTAYLANTKYSERVTSTITFLTQIDFALVYVCGADKKPKLDEVLKNQSKVNNLPALVWHEIKDTKIFTDIS